MGGRGIGGRRLSLMSGKRLAWDLFISHASEDKEVLVRPLATELSRLGLRVWYDEFSLRVGDSLSMSIDRGLAESEAGLVVISPSFIAKPWPRRELAGLVAGEVGRNQVIVPVWLNVTREEVFSFSPPLSDKVAVIATEFDLPELALLIVERVKPELFEAFQRRLAYDQMVENAEIEFVNPSDLKTDGPIRHETLPFVVANRIRLMREVLLEVFHVDWLETINNFRKDLNPEREIILFEYIAGVYLVVVNEFRLSHEERGELFRKIFSKIGAADALSWNPADDAPEWEKRAYKLCTPEVDPLDGNFGSIITAPSWL